MARWRRSILIAAVVALAVGAATAATQAAPASPGSLGGRAAVAPSTVERPAALLNAVPRVDPGAVVRSVKARGFDGATTTPALVLFACTLLLWSCVGFRRPAPALALVRTAPSRGPPAPFTR